VLHGPGSELGASRQIELGEDSSTLHCMTVSLAQSGEGLGAMWGEQQACKLLTEAGLVVVDVKQVAGDIINSYYVCTRS
jgi:hypothetical protein